MAAGALAAVGLLAPSAAPVAHAAGGTTAWQNGRFVTDPANLVRRADVVLGAPNTTQAQSMPLGNGTLGAAVWAAGGFTAQLNRADTLPERLSPGWVTIPGLAKMTGATDFAARLDPYDATLYESGGGMTATVYVRADKDELVVDVTGADPAAAQTAQLNLWAGRSPQVLAGSAIGTLAQSWADDTETGSSGGTYGAMAALTAGGAGVSVAAVDSETVKVTVTPHADGTFRIIVAAPHWTGGDAQATAASLIGTDASAASATLSSGHLAWWHSFWGRVGLMKLSSTDGTADYMESLRTLDLYDAAAESRDAFPGSQAGVADLFSVYQDSHRWEPADYWHWNLRMQVQANISSGAFDLNTPYFNLYQQNLANIQAWTTANMGGRAGICVPETMRFNGNGWGYSSGAGKDLPDCDAATSAWYNARTISTGAEVGLWVWQQYLSTGDKTFLQTHYPLMSNAAQFLLAYATTGTDGYLHTYPSNAHETQWDVHDPTTDLAAERALFPATVAAAKILGTDQALATRLTAAEAEVEPFARTDAATQSRLLTPADDAAGQDVIADSYDPSATKENSENIGLEPVWPYGLIGDSGPLTTLAQRTFANRPNKQADDWSDDPLQAARLGEAADVAATLVGLTEKYQKLPSGLASFVGNEPYGEQQGVVAAALNESVAQDYDGVLRIAPALPSGWDADGTVFIQGGSTVSVQVHGGVVGTVGINSGSTGAIQVRSPWPGQSVEVVDGTDESTVVVGPTTASRFAIPAVAGASYLVQPVAAPVSGMTFSTLTAAPATGPRSLGPVTIGIPAPAATGTYTLVGTGSGRCLDDPGSSTTGGTRVQLWDCDGGANQQWTYGSDGSLTTLGQCLDAYAGGTTPGTSVIIWPCRGTSYQKWTLAADGTIRGVGSNLCVGAVGAGTANGTLIELETCTGAANQTWTHR